jgi:hypothetical protein
MKKKLIICLSIVTIWIVIIMGFLHINAIDKKNQEADANIAAAFGLSYAQDACGSENEDNSMCNSLTSDATMTECSNGYVCWSVYVKSTRDNNYLRTMLVERIDPAKDGSLNHLKVTQYEKVSFSPSE